MIPTFSRGMVMPNKEIIIDVLGKGSDYAILNIDQKRKGIFIEQYIYDCLFACDELRDFVSIKFSRFETGYYYVGKPDYKVYSAICGPYADYFSEVIDYCSALKRFHDVYPQTFWEDAIFIEEFNIILPIVSTDNSTKSIDALVGAWLAEGLEVNASDTEKVILLNQWLSKENIVEALQAAGIENLSNGQTSDIVKSDTNGKTNSYSYEIPFVLPGRVKLTQYFNDQIVDFIKNIEKYERMGIHSIPATLLYGKPGCGKTYAVEKLAEYLGLPCYEIGSNSVASPYIHDTSKKIGEVFEKAIDTAPSVLIIDEMEAYLSKRENGSSGNHHIEEVDEFLRNIPKALEAKVIIFGMTNMLELIDPAILRKGRFDFIKEVGMPSKEEILSVLKNGLSNIPHNDNVDLSNLAEELLDRPMSDISYVLRQAARIAVQENDEEVCQCHFEKAIETLGTVEKEEKPRRIGF